MRQEGGAENRWKSRPFAKALGFFLPRDGKPWKVLNKIAMGSDLLSSGDFLFLHPRYTSQSTFVFAFLINWSRTYT